MASAGAGALGGWAEVGAGTAADPVGESGALDASPVSLAAIGFSVDGVDSVDMVRVARVFRMPTLGAWGVRSVPRSGGSAARITKTRGDSRPPHPRGADPGVRVQMQTDIGPMTGWHTLRRADFGGGWC
ncbi:MAG: hypothetical protein DHS20C14_05710 [Phycisphaeraceae bacterium]|nr:MAG: hypothetical protein DHS20C14_05710 [Phycisphaeraceae bacterium]